VLVRSDGEAIAVNLDIEPVEEPETVLWLDSIHREPAEQKLCQDRAQRIFLHRKPSAAAI
jgi:hypothetical protein